MICKLYSCKCSRLELSNHILHLTTIREISFELRALIVGPEVSVENLETLLAVSQPVLALKYSAHGNLCVSAPDHFLCRPSFREI